MTTLQNFKMKLAGSRCGRMSLHLLCLCQDKKLRWHVCGIVRELRDTIRSFKRALASLQGVVQDATNFSGATRTTAPIPDTVLLKKSLSHVA